MKQKGILAVLILLVAVITSMGASAYPSGSIDFYTYSDEQFVNTSVLSEYYVDDERIDDYFYESFDGEAGEYDFIDGVSTEYAYGLNAKKTNVDSESFDWAGNDRGTGALWFNFTDGTTSPGAAHLPNVYLDNGTFGDDVSTIEFDFLLEDDTEYTSIGGTWFDGRWGINFTADGENDTFFTSTTNPDIEQTFGFAFSSGVWHHLILSYTNNLIDGFELTCFVDNASVVITDGRLDTPTVPFSTIYTWIDTGVVMGRDIVIDNLVFYNGSFNSTEIGLALSGSYLDAQLNDLLAVVITMAMLGMVIGLIKKFTA